MKALLISRDESFDDEVGYPVINKASVTLIRKQR